MFLDIVNGWIEIKLPKLKSDFEFSRGETNFLLIYASFHCNISE